MAGSFSTGFLRLSQAVSKHADSKMSKKYFIVFCPYFFSWGVDASNPRA